MLNEQLGYPPPSWPQQVNHSSLSCLHARFIGLSLSLERKDITSGIMAVFLKLSFSSFLQGLAFATACRTVLGAVVLSEPATPVFFSGFLLWESEYAWQIVYPRPGIINRPDSVFVGLKRAENRQLAFYIC